MILTLNQEQKDYIVQFIKLSNKHFQRLKIFSVAGALQYIQRIVRQNCFAVEKHVSVQVSKLAGKPKSTKIFHIFDRPKSVF